MAVFVRGQVEVSTLLLQRCLRPSVCQGQRFYRRKDTPLPDQSIYQRLTHVKRPYREREVFPREFATEPVKGKIYDKKPFKMTLVPGKTYAWCTCGASKNQPLCDGSHKQLDGTGFTKTQPKFRPHRFTVDEEKEYWLCNCKQTDNVPFCDGTHKQQEIQDAVKG